MGTVLTRPQEKQFTLRKASSCTRRCSFRVAPIDENSSLLPPVGVWAVLNPSVADHPLRPATDRGLGELLPHQQANRPQAHPKAPLRALFPEEHMRYCRRFLAGIPHLGAGTHVLLTRPPLPLLREGVRLACVRHAASVYPEPGSNSPFKCECIFHTTATQRCSKHCKFASRLEARCRYFKLLVRRIDRNGVLRKQDKLTQRSSVVLLHSTLQLFRVLWFVLLLLVEPQPGKPVGLRLYSWCRSGVRGVRARR